MQFSIFAFFNMPFSSMFPNSFPANNQKPKIKTRHFGLFLFSFLPFFRIWVLCGFLRRDWFIFVVHCQRKGQQFFCFIFILRCLSFFFFPYFPHFRSISQRVRRTEQNPKATCIDFIYKSYCSKTLWALCQWRKGKKDEDRNALERPTRRREGLLQVDWLNRLVIRRIFIKG